ncbi:hypothetical protein FB45DRAFT_1038254 [Roridomyces roridus]|uniref:Uncharacterized protein n=1 Tax=Roridomyces roridus TaxID=1738132 RepID=A0AAD7B5H1_9AGAR|nr:hypothetical protein FB45DRAFT_1038254 [Roridomyces roridus]
MISHLDSGVPTEVRLILYIASIHLIYVLKGRSATRWYCQLVSWVDEGSARLGMDQLAVTLTVVGHRRWIPYIAVPHDLPPISSSSTLFPLAGSQAIEDEDFVQAFYRGRAEPKDEKLAQAIAVLLVGAGHDGEDGDDPPPPHDILSTCPLRTIYADLGLADTSSTLPSSRICPTHPTEHNDLATRRRLRVTTRPMPCVQAMTQWRTSFARWPLDDHATLQKRLYLATMRAAVFTPPLILSLPNSVWSIPITPLLRITLYSTRPRTARELLASSPHALLVSSPYDDWMPLFRWRSF